jgi:PHD/YefM family antitoxin component YafN of YafNO toxin-antitoxin module
MVQDQLVSITDLRKNTSKIFKSLVKGPRFILANNKMEAVVLSPDEYQRMKDVEKAKEIRQDIAEAKNSSKGFSNGRDLVNSLLEDD